MCVCLGFFFPRVFPRGLSGSGEGLCGFGWAVLLARTIYGVFSLGSSEKPEKALHLQVDGLDF